MGTSSASGFTDIEVRRILVASEHHATSLVEDAIVRTRGYIINESEKGSIGIFGGRSLFLNKLVETDKEFVNNISNIIE